MDEPKLILPGIKSKPGQQARRRSAAEQGAQGKSKNAWKRSSFPDGSSGAQFEDSDDDGQFRSYKSARGKGGYNFFYQYLFFFYFCE